MGTFHKRAKIFLSRVSFRYFGVLFIIHVFSSLFICPCLNRTFLCSSEELTSKAMLVLLELQEDNKIPKKSCKFGKVVVGITGATALGNRSCQYTVCHAKICLPYVPATERQVANIIKTAKTSKRQGSTMVDLGSGNGRVASFSLKLVYHSTR